MGKSWEHRIFQDIPNGGFNGKFIYQWGDFRCQIFLGISNFKQLDKNMTVNLLHHTTLFRHIQINKRSLSRYPILLFLGMVEKDSIGIILLFSGTKSKNLISPYCSHRNRQAAKLIRNLQPFMSGKPMQENKVDSAALGYFVVCWGAFENTQVIEPQLVERALVIPRDHQCAHKPFTEEPQIHTSVPITDQLIAVPVSS